MLPLKPHFLEIFLQFSLLRFFTPLSTLFFPPPEDMELEPKHQSSEPEDTFFYFTSYAMETWTSRRGGDAVDKSECELDFFNNILRLQEFLITKPQDKDKLTLIAGDIIIDLFILAKQCKIEPCQERLPATDIENTNGYIQIEKLITFTRLYLHHYRTHYARKFRKIQTKQDLASWSNRICQLLVHISGMSDIHALLKAKIQRPGIEELLGERDSCILENFHLEERLLSLRIHPPTYNLKKISWTQIVTFFKECGIDVTQNSVSLDYLVEKVLDYTVQKTYGSANRQKDFLSRKLFCSTSLLNLKDSRTLWFPVSRWLTIDSFETICEARCPELLLETGRKDNEFRENRNKLFIPAPLLVCPPLPNQTVKREGEKEKKDDIFHPRQFQDSKKEDDYKDYVNY